MTRVQDDQFAQGGGYGPPGAPPPGGFGGGPPPGGFGGPPGGGSPPGGYGGGPPGGPPGGYGGGPPGYGGPPPGPPGGYGGPPPGYGYPPAPPPGFGGPTGPAAEIKKQATTWLIVSAVTFFVFCGNCFGLIGGVLCFLAMQAADQNNVPDAEVKLKWGKIITIAGAVIAIVGAVLSTILWGLGLVFQ